VPHGDNDSTLPRQRGRLSLMTSLSFRLSWVLLLMPACGLFKNEPTLPDAEDIQEAREDAAQDWFVLEKAASLWTIQGEDVLPQLKDWCQQPHASLRLRAFVLDLEFRSLESGPDKSAFSRRLSKRWEETQQPEDAYLAARFSPHPDALELVNAALELSPDLVPAQVLQLGLQAQAGDPLHLNRLIALLEENPGNAEAWRLLSRLALFFNRPDLAFAAAEQEPWIQSEWNPAGYQAALALDAGQADLALSYLEKAEDGIQITLLRAQAFLDQGDALEAGRLLDELVREYPDSLTVHFNYGVLAQGPLKQPELARREFEAVLRLAGEGQTLPIQRRLQVELWLERL